MKNGRPKLGYSSLYWKKIDKKRSKPTKAKLEVLCDPVSLDDEKLVPDIFCPPDLTKEKHPVILYTSATTMEKIDE